LRLAALWRRRSARTGVWAALALALPLAARAHLERGIDRDLEPALAGALGMPVAVGSLDATLTGVVRLSDLTAGPALSIEAVEAAFDPADLAAGDLDPSEVRLSRPRLRLAGAGDPVWTRLRERLSRRRRGAGRSAAPSRLRHLVVNGGLVEIELPRGGLIRAASVELRPRGAGWRVVAGPVAVAWRPGGAWQARATFSRAAVDLGGSAPARLLAIGGELALAQPGGQELALAGATLTSGIGGPTGELRLAGRIAGRETGRLAAAVGLDGARAELDLEAVPLAFLGPLVSRFALVEAARASGTVSLASRGSELAATADLALEKVLVTHPLVSSEPVALDGSIAARGSLRRVAGRRLLAIDQLRLARAGLAVDLHGLLEWAGAAALPARGQLELTVPETPCAGALAAVPDGLRQRLAGFEVDGAVAGALALAFDRADPDATQLGIALDLDRCRVIAEPALSDPLRLAAPFDLELADGGRLRVGEGPDQVALARLPRHVIGAFIAAEDARFFRHGGFDPEQIERSLAIDLDSGKLLRGGSTISQQLVKNVFLGPERTVARKLQEAVLTWRLEARLGKRVILERYLNLIELGEDVHGIAAAARHWFARPAEKLSVRQAAFLAALTPAPRTFSREVRASGGLPADVADKVDIVLRAMRVSRVIDRATYERARREPLHLAPTALSRSP